MTLDTTYIATFVLWMIVAFFTIFGASSVSRAFKLTKRGQYSIDMYWSAVFSALAGLCWLAIIGQLHEIVPALAAFDPVALGLLVVTALASSAALLLALFDSQEITRGLHALRRIFVPTTDHRKQA